MKRQKTHSLQTRTMFYNMVIVGSAVGWLTGLFLFEQHLAVDRQLLLRAEELAQFLASQSQFALLVGNRTELARIAASTLRNEDVVYTRFRDSAGAVLGE